MTLYCSCIQLLTVKSDSVTKARGWRCASPCIYLVHYTYELIVDELILSVKCVNQIGDEIGAFVCVSERIMKVVLGEGKGGETLPQYQQVARSWKVVQPADFRESVWFWTLQECSGKCEKQAKQDGSYLFAFFSLEIMITRLRDRKQL